jgi:hypothetical protein
VRLKAAPVRVAVGAVLSNDTYSDSGERRAQCGGQIVSHPTSPVLRQGIVKHNESHHHSLVPGTSLHRGVIGFASAKAPRNRSSSTVFRYQRAFVID